MKLSRKNIWIGLFATFLVVLPFGPALPNLMAGAILAFWLFELLHFRVQASRRDWLEFLVINGYVLLHFLSLFWSDDLAHGLQKSLLLVFIPLFFLVMRHLKGIFSISDAGLLVGCFTFSTSILSILSLSVAMNAPEFSLDALLQENLATSLINFHYLGFSLYVGAAIVLTLTLWLFHRNSMPQWYRKPAPIILIFLLGILLLLSSRSTIVFTLILSVFLLWRARKIASTPEFLGIIAIIVLAVVFVFSNRALIEKFKDAVNFEGQYEVTEYWGGRGFRELIWDCTAHVIEANPALGTGYGDQQTELELCFRRHRYQALLLKGNTFNAHNLFLQITLATGLVGLVLFLTSLVYATSRLWNREATIYFAFLVLFLGTSLTESHFNRNAIVLLFAFFHAFFYFKFSAYERSSDT
ncbi:MULTISPECIES: O-antigen ligase family protein [unclassified Robiginitalea]|uniref:O-antigen ligase family protein n=1 Tax=Robiginitalea TaxID=252306 RepID=UPI00234B403A|nr:MULTISPECIES: O-antigen ligase family protein [unclassified Robiginitalea]MDC6353200.1 O-antigen ligase family protein [Robiginitalea sp. PM2]MDC6373633.1 O-antigen ligase family protein [Robiginitalea sp. SP8]